MGSENVYMWHDCMFQHCKLVATKLLIGCYIYISCNVIAMHNYSATCQKIKHSLLRPYVRYVHYIIHIYTLFNVYMYIN
jgi:hypothetical protein